MIGKLKGRIEETGADHLVVDVGGVGYLVQASSRTLSRAGGVGEAVVLFIETVVREDAIRLFGFLSAEEREWFRLLQTVQGVGAKVALALLSALAPGELSQAIVLQDKAAVSRTPGIGPKLAQRIVTELKDKAGALTAPLPVAAGKIVRAPQGVAAEAASALVNLGYSMSDAAGAVASALAELGEGTRLDALIRAALRQLAR